MVIGRKSVTFGSTKKDTTPVFEEFVLISILTSEVLTPVLDESTRRLLDTHFLLF